MGQHTWEPFRCCDLTNIYRASQMMLSLAARRHSPELSLQNLSLHLHRSGSDSNQQAATARQQLSHVWKSDALLVREGKALVSACSESHDATLLTYWLLKVRQSVNLELLRLI